MSPLISQLIIAAIVSVISPTQAFVVNPALLRAKTEQFATTGDDASKDLFESDAWKDSISKNLDELPVFTCANEQGNPLAYTIEVKDKTHTVPFFYCDVDDAKAELEKAKEGSGVDGLDIIPFPLRKAFELWARDDAVIVPSKMAIVQAGAPPGTNPIGQQVPLFTCMDIMQTNEDGSGGMLPMFMVLDEAQTALSEAVKADGGKVEDFEVVSLSLSRAVELLATVSDNPETPGFQFIGPKKSFKYIAEYLS